MAIKERVITELKKKGIKAFQAEEDLHLARGYISKLDKSNPGADKLILLADYLGVTVDYLLDRHTPAYSPHIADFASRLIKLPPDYQKAVYEALDYQEYRYEKSKKSLELSKEENDAFMVSKKIFNFSKEKRRFYSASKSSLTTLSSNFTR